jgi:Domain of unknown function (DUF4390)
MSGRPRLFSAAVLALAGLLLWAAPAWAEGRIDRVDVARDGRMLAVGAHLAGGFPPEIADQIQNGVPKDLFYTVTLKRRHRNWFDEGLTDATVHYTIKYDTLAGRYRIRRFGADGEVSAREVETYADAVANVSTIEAVPLTLPKDAEGNTHYVAVKAEMRAVKLPLLLDYVFFFIPRLEYETPWARSENVESLQ